LRVRGGDAADEVVGGVGDEERAVVGEGEPRGLVKARRRAVVAVGEAGAESGDDARRAVRRDLHDAPAV
jgi:hypothetical protein